MPVQSWRLDVGGQWRLPDSAPAAAPVNVRDTLDYGTYKPTADLVGHVGTLTTWAGNLTTSANNQVIENLDITGRLTISHTGVVVRNCRIRGGTPPDYATDNAFGAVKAWSALSPGTQFYDCTFDPSAMNVNFTCGIQGRDFSLYRCNIYGSVDGVKAQYGNVGVYGSWIHDLPFYAYDPRQTDGSHNDGIQCEGGGGGYVFRGNLIEMGAEATSCILATQNVGVCTGLVIDRNWLMSLVPGGGTSAPGAAINITQKGLGAMSNVSVTGNRFSDGASWKNANKPVLIDSNTYDAATISGNVYDSSGSAAPITRVTV